MNVIDSIQFSATLIDCALLFVAERTLEDHEDILQVWKEGETLIPIHERRFDFEPNFTRYEYFNNPKV